MASWWLRRVSWRRTVLASLLAFLLINLLCFAVRSFWPLLYLRLLAGLSAGAAYPIALAGVMDTTRAPRNTGLMMSLQVVFGAAGVYAIDAVRVTWRLDAFYAFLCGGLLTALFVGARWYPDDPGDRPPAGQIAWRVLAGRGSPGGVAVIMRIRHLVWCYAFVPRRPECILQFTDRLLWYTVHPCSR